MSHRDSIYSFAILGCCSETRGYNSAGKLEFVEWGLRSCGRWLWTQREVPGLDGIISGKMWVWIPWHTREVLPLSYLYEGLHRQLKELCSYPFFLCRKRRQPNLKPGKLWAWLLVQNWSSPPPPHPLLPDYDSATLGEHNWTFHSKSWARRFGNFTKLINHKKLLFTSGSLWPTILGT